jgi:ABC-2 type transport system permease protein
LSAAPGNLGWVFVGRSLQWPISGSATSVVALFAVAPWFGVRWEPSQVAPVILLVILTAAATYCFGLLLGAFVLAAPGLRNITSNVAYLVMMAICGVVTPVTAWPPVIQAVAHLLPLTYGLEAIRAVRDGRATGTVLVSALAIVVTGAVFLLLALISFHWFDRRAKRRGTLALSS